MDNPVGIAAYKRTARTSFWPWAMLAVGIAFAYLGSTIDPARNCDESGNCAPWLVPIGYVMGIGLILMSVGPLWANPTSGSYIDPETGDLIWWKNRNPKVAGDSGRLHPSRIGRIRIVRLSERADEVHLYDIYGALQPWFDAEVIPFNQEKWAKRLIAAWPHIQLDIED